MTLKFYLFFLIIGVSITKSYAIIVMNRYKSLDNI